MTSPVEFISQHDVPPFVDGWYELADESHFWFQWRMQAALRQFRELHVPTGEKLKALEVGCGNGVLRAQFEAETNWDVDGSDLDRKALCLIAPARGRTLYYDICDEAPAFLEAYDVLILFDVLEHVADTRPFIASLLRHLKCGGLLLLNVPAVPALYSAYDRTVGHVRRYSEKSLRDEFSGAPVEILDTRYWGFSLVPVALLRRLVLSRKSEPQKQVRRGFQPPAAAINKFLGSLGRVETRLLSKPPIGSSLLMIARKTN